MMKWRRLIEDTPDGDPDCWIADKPDMSVYPKGDQWEWVIWAKDEDSRPFACDVAETKEAAMQEAEQAWEWIEAHGGIEDA